ncbi:hypothetical protein [Empedobacter brevis]|uniref:hypothetical protein n=1 Tax=Empedobacter brevis TaxID=247 RepID=UPI002898528A|nr:hypothetical protein [Empedobacter brevis]
MKRKLLNILTISSIITTLGFILDGDLVEASIFMQFAEFFGMIGIVFLLVSLIYFPSAFVLRNIRRTETN